MRSVLLSATATLFLAACGIDESGVWRLGLTPAAAAAPGGGDETAAGSYLVGRFALESGDLHRAAQSLERALLADPDNVELRRQVFALLVVDGQFERAVTVGRELTALDKGAQDAMLFLALDDVRRGDYAGATRRLEAVGGGLAGTVQPILLAWARFGAGQRDQALVALSAGGPHGGLDRLRIYHRAMMLGLSGKPREGLAALREAFPELATAPVRLVRAAARLAQAADGRDAALQLIAQARAAEPDDPQLAWLEQAIRSGRPDVAAIQGPPSGMSDALSGIAEALAEQEGHTQALLFARLATFLTPDDGEGWLLIANTALQQDNAAEALRALDHIRADGPLGWQAGLTRARALQSLDRGEEAIRLLQTMADEAPERSDSLIALGDYLRSKERFAEAADAYTRAIQRIGKPEKRHWRLFYARGICFERTKRWPEAEADLLEALELEPDQPFVLNYLGYSWVDQGTNLDRAKEMLHKAVDLRPEDGYIVDSLGWAYYRLGEYDKAVTYLERAVELEPGDAVINDHLGDAYWRVGRTREARFQWERAVTFKPEPDVLAQIQEKLQKGLPDAAAKRG
ncbi:tetratricopeptide repeat protein [Benzoatithermus flavus]|uniref:Tetratricopeptide repeat protein n=1 Tax=Benzoatithermus flavus TaxID=3108223 RepID=A0ABU8XU27_9PROT